MEIESINTGNSSYDKIRHKDSPQQNTQRSQSADEDFDRPDDLENDDLDQVSPRSKDRTQTSRTPSGMIKTDTGYIKDPNASDPNLLYEDFYGKDKQDVYTSTAGSLRNNGAPLYSDPIAAREALKEQYNRAKGITGEKTLETPEAAAEAEMQQQQFLETAQTVDGEGNVTMDPRVATMLEKGMFSDNDSQGKSLMENLNALKSQKFHPGIDGDQVYQEVLETLSNPESTKQGFTGNCVPTVSQYKLAKENPAEYVRLLSGITGNDGTVQMRNGEPLELNKTALSEDGSTRRLTDRLFQASLMEYGKDGYVYNNKEDKQYPLSKNDNSGILYTNDIFNYKNNAMPGSLNSNEYTKVLNSLLPYQSECKIVHDDTKRSSIEQDLTGTLQGGRSVPVILNWAEKNDPHASHTLTLERIEGDKVILRNPWGQRNNEYMGEGLPREFVTKENGEHGGMIAVDKEVFYKSLHSYELPMANQNNEENLH